MNDHRQESKPLLIIVHLPAHLKGRPLADIKRVLSNPMNRTLDVLAEQCHAMINNPDTSLDLLIAKMEAERKAGERGTALPPGAQEVGGG